MPTSENALQDMRIEFVREDVAGEPPTDPDFRPFSAEISEISASIDATKEATESVGQRDLVEFYRGPEESELTVSYAQYNFPVDTSGNVLDPAGFPMTLPQGEYPSLTVTSRQDVPTGGKLGAGFREYLIVTGARPTSVSLDGDPSAAEPIPQELTLPCETARPHIIHQPDSASTLVVRSTSADDVNNVIIEDEGGNTSATVTLPGSSPNTVSTTTDFGDIDSIFVEGDHLGDIQVGLDDGSGSIDTELLESPLTGINTDGVDSVSGVPPLGSGSHATQPTGRGQIFIGTDATFAGDALGERIHTLNVSVNHDSSREPIQDSRRQEIDVGQRTIEIDADLAGPFESADLIKQHFRDKEGDLIYGFGDADDPANADKQLIFKNVQLVDGPDFTRTAGDTNFIPSVTFQAVAKDGSAIEVVNNS